MKKLLILLSCLLSLHNSITIAQCTSNWVIPDDPGITSGSLENPPYKPGWHLIIQDEFSGISLDNTIWGARKGTVDDCKSFVNNDAENIEVSNGTLKLYCVWDPKLYQDPTDGIFRWYNYIGAWVTIAKKIPQESSNACYGPGYFYEIRCKRNNVGFKSSFWTWTGYPHNEVDFIDNDFDTEDKVRDVLFNVFPDDTLNNIGITYKINNNLPAQYDDWYTYSIDYQNDYIKSYLNNQLALNRNTNIPLRKQEIDLWCMPIYWADDLMQQIHDEGKFPGKFEIDYFRLYKKNYEVNAYMSDFCISQGWTNQNERPRFIADINNDGKKDIIGFGYQWVQISLSQNDKDISFGDKQYVVNDYTIEQGWTNQSERPRMIADLNGDGKDDIIGFGYDGVFVSLSNSTATTASFLPQQKFYHWYSKEYGWVNQDQYPRMMADVNGDGKADIIGFGSDGVYVSLSSSTSTTASFSTPVKVLSDFSIVQGWTNQNEMPRMMADVNGDGKADIIGFGSDGVYVSLSNSTTTTASFSPPLKVLSNFSIAQGWTDQNIRPRMMADVNGDGKADIVGFGYGGVYISLSNYGSTPQFLPLAWAATNFSYEQGYYDSNNYPRFVCDINNDNKADIIGFNENMIQIAISKSTTSGVAFDQYNNVFDEFTRCNGWNNNDEYPRFLTDVNGDGSLDLIGFGYENIYTSQNIGGVYNIPFNIISSNKGKANNWPVHGTGGRDVAYKFYLPDAMNITASTNFPETNFSTIIEIFNASDNTTTGYYSLNKSTPISNAQLQPGYYYIVVDGNNGATGKFKLSMNGTISMNGTKKLSLTSNITNKNNQTLFDFNVYPNPAINKITIEIPTKESTLTILNVNGQELIKLQIKDNKTQIDISKFDKGIYFIKLKTDNKVEVRKIIKE